MVEKEQMGIVPEFNNNMRTKNILRATLLAATLVVAGYGGMKAYDYSYARRVNSDDAMLMLNVEALTQDGEQSTCSVTAKCFTPDSVEYGTVSCSGVKDCRVYYGYVICEGTMTSCS